MGGKAKYGGLFHDEIDSAKRVNQLCEEFEISPKNPEVTGVPTANIKTKSSQFNGVYWKQCDKKWIAKIYVNGNAKYGGLFDDEIEAAKRVNQLCEEFEISPKNQEVTGQPSLRSNNNTKNREYHGVSW